MDHKGNIYNIENNNLNDYFYREKKIDEQRGRFTCK